MNRILTRRAFGLPSDPWSRIHIDTADAGRVADMADAAIRDHALVQIVGDAGAGKSTALWRAIDAHPLLDREADLIHVQRLDRESRTIADVVSAIYRTLGEPRPTRAEDRDAQLRQVLGRATRERAEGREHRRLLLLLDDAHHLHWRTISALKGLRELSWLGRAPLIGVILLSQRDVLSRTAEIRERADTVHLSGPTAAEADTALHQAAGAILSDQARAILAGSARTWNRLIWQLDAALAAAQADGSRTIEHRHALAAVGTDARTLRQLAEDSGRTHTDLAREAGVSKSHLSHVLSGRRADDALAQRLAALLTSDIPAADQPRAAGGAA
jgi:type II secretory pathway predicted ATPase ExeA